MDAYYRYINNCFAEYKDCSICNSQDYKDDDNICIDCFDMFNSTSLNKFILNIFKSSYDNFPISSHKEMYITIPSIITLNKDDTITYNYKYNYKYHDIYVKSNCLIEEKEIVEKIEETKDVYILNYNMYDFYKNLFDNGVLYTGTKTDNSPLITIGQKKPRMKKYQYALMITSDVKIHGNFKVFEIKDEQYNKYFKRQNKLKIDKCEKYKKIEYCNLSEIPSVYISYELKCNVIYYWN